MNYQEVQMIAKKTMDYIKKMIKPGMNLIEVRKICEDKMLELGADSFWYWDIGAFIFSGEETSISISGKRYQTASKLIETNDIITIDLSPQNNHIWGDYARTIIIENGQVITEIEKIKNKQWQQGLMMEEKLHQELFNYVTVATTFEDLYYHMNTIIEKSCFVNLDFLGNLGHSIVTRSDDRIYIEKGNNQKLSDVAFFTFEPHISIKGSVFGFKKENIYYFDQNKLKVL